MTTRNYEESEKISIESFRSEHFRTEMTLRILGIRNMDADGTLLFFSERIVYTIKGNGEKIYAETGDIFSNEETVYTLTKSNGEKIGTFATRAKMTKFIKVHFVS